MSIFNQLKNNKGTIATALSKELAAKALNGEKEILEEAVKLCSYNVENQKVKNIRAGACKIVEKVAEKKPEWVASFLNDLFPALEAKEPQTQWMLMMIFSHCMQLNTTVSSKAFPYAKKYIEEKQGLGTVGAAVIYLGKHGALSSENAEQSAAILNEISPSAEENLQDWIIEAYINIFPSISEKNKKQIAEILPYFEMNQKKVTQKRILKLKKLFIK